MHDSIKFIKVYPTMDEAHTFVMFENNMGLCSCMSINASQRPWIPNLRVFPYVDDDTICPECKNGKCVNCTDVTLNDQDVMVPCCCPNPHL